MVVGCHQQPTIAAIFFDNGSHIIGNIPTVRSPLLYQLFKNKNKCTHILERNPKLTHASSTHALLSSLDP
jgi:hypothetical protein